MSAEFSRIERSFSSLRRAVSSPFTPVPPTLRPVAPLSAPRFFCPIELSPNCRHRAGAPTPRRRKTILLIAIRQDSRLGKRVGATRMRSAGCISRRAGRRLCSWPQQRHRQAWRPSQRVGNRTTLARRATCPRADPPLALAVLPASDSRKTQKTVDGPGSG